MSANLFGGRFMGFRQPAWHNLGTVFTDPITASQAVERGDMLFRVDKHPLFSPVEDNGVQALFGGAAVSTSNISIPDRYSLLRTPTADDPQYRCFGIVGEQYQVLQNEDLARLLDPLTEKWPVETVGALGYGEKVFMTLSTGKHDVKGEELLLYFLVTDTRDGDSSLKVAFTPVRVVCQNTLTSGLRQSVVNVALSHHQAIKNELDFRFKLMRQMQDVQNTVLSSFTLLAEAVLLPNNVDEILKLCYPAPARPKKAELILDELDDAERALLPGEILTEAKDVDGRWEYYRDLSGKRREQAKELFGRFNSEFPQTAGTAWALYNAVVENEDFRDGPSTMFESAVFGKRAATKRRAYEACLEAAQSLPARVQQVAQVARRGRKPKAA